MATLVLSTVGTLLGGPVGGAIGGLLGQSIDQQLFGPGPRQGPRVGDLAVQTSTYGTPIPRLFGTMRVAGSIVWSTDLQEDSQTSGAKGQPDSVTYSYSVSFAVAVSSRRIADIGRIWADGKLIRTAEGVFTVPTTFRFHTGSEDQPVDPLIATVEGLDGAPAYRGTALAVFEHLQLAEFGNRIPFLTFEVVADAAPLEAGTILAEVSGGSIAASAPVLVAGYAAHGAAVSSAVEPLVEVLAIPLLDDGTALVSPPATLVVAGEEELGCSAGPEHADRRRRSQVPASDLPSSLSLTYYDANREYQAGLARAATDDRSGANGIIELPAVVEAGSAKALAESALARRWAERDRLALRLPPAYAGLLPGSLVQAGADQQKWVAEKVTLDSFVVVAELRPAYSSSPPLPADPGRSLPSLGVVPAPTLVTVAEMPSDTGGETDSPVVVVAASASSGRWRPVPLEVQLGSDTVTVSASPGAAIQGVADTALGSGQAALIDQSNAVEVVLANDDDWIQSVDDEALVNGANLALIGRELVQFGGAFALAPKRFRLSRLLRGRRGTEWAMAIHRQGEPFVMVDAARLKRIDVKAVDAGGTLRVKPKGLGDGSALPVELTISGEAMRPPSPVHLRAAIQVDGGVTCSWVRRSSRGWAWLDSVDSPVAAARELYRVSLRRNGSPRLVETGAPYLALSATELAELGSGNLNISVVQVGDFAASRPAELILIIG